MPIKSLEDYFKSRAKGEAITRDEEMRLEYLRIASFQRWPLNSVNTLALAKSGFYYIGDGSTDTVKCFSCKVTISNWNENRDPTKEHSNASPNCRFLNQRAHDHLGNIPLQESGLSLNSLLSGPNVFIPRPNYENSQDTHDSSSTTSPETPNPPPDQQHTHLRPIPSPPLTRPIEETQALPEYHPPNIQQTITPFSSNYRFSQFETDPNSTDPRRTGTVEYLARMRSEQERRNTYYDFPRGAQLRPEPLAAAGFFYTGSADRTMCAFCRGVLRNWEPGDSPMDEHHRYFPECPFVRGRAVGNIPAPNRPYIQSPVPHSQTPVPEPIVPPVSYPQVNAPVHRDMADMGKRLTTFTHWPTELEQSPMELAEAGFYYTGQRDSVRCFHCDGGLVNWEPQDIAWVEHAFHFPLCGYVRNCKGDIFIRDVRAATIKPSRNHPPPGMQLPERPTSEVRARMDSPIVQRVQEMGFPTDIIRQVIENQLRSTGNDFTSAEGLVEAIFAFREATTPTSSQQPITTQQQPGASMPPQSIQGPRPSQPTTFPHTRPRPVPHQTPSLPPYVPGTPQIPITGQSPEIQNLIREHENLLDQRLCRVCMDKEVNVVFLPCAHLCCCNNCAPRLRTCPICRQPVRGSVRIYIP